MSAGLTPAETATLTALADLLVPAAEAMPAASAVGMPGKLLEQVLHARPDWRLPLRAALREAEGEDPAAFIAEFSARDPEAMRILGLVIAGGYYLSPEVRLLLSFPGQQRQSYDPDAALDAECEEMLQRVIARGRLWRGNTA